MDPRGESSERPLHSQTISSRFKSPTPRAVPSPLPPATAPPADASPPPPDREEEESNVRLCSLPEGEMAAITEVKE